MLSRPNITRKVFKTPNLDLKTDQKQNKPTQKAIRIQDSSTKDEYHDNTKPAIQLPRPSSSKKDNTQSQNESRQNKFTVSKSQPRIIEINTNNFMSRSVDPNIEKIIEKHVNVVTESNVNRQVFDEILRTPADCHNHRLYVSSDCKPRGRRVYVSKGVPLNQKLCNSSYGDRAKKAFELFKEKQMEVNIMNKETNIKQNNYTSEVKERHPLTKNNSVYVSSGVRANKRFYNNLDQPNIIDLKVEPDRSFHKVTYHTLKPNHSSDFYRYNKNNYSVNRYAESSERIENFDLPNEQKTYNDNSEVRTKTYQTADGKFVTVTTTVTVSDRNPLAEPVNRTNERIFRRNKIAIKSMDPDLPKFINDIREKEFNQELQRVESRFYSRDKGKTYTEPNVINVAQDKTYTTDEGKILIRRTVFRDPKNVSKKKERIEYDSGSKYVLSNSNDRNYFNTSSVSQSMQSNKGYKSSNKFQTYSYVNKFNKPTGTVKPLEINNVIPATHNKSRHTNSCIKNYKKREESGKAFESKAKNCAFYSSSNMSERPVVGETKQIKPYINAYRSKDMGNTNKESSQVVGPKRTTNRPFVPKKAVNKKKT